MRSLQLALVAILTLSAAAAGAASSAVASASDSVSTSIGSVSTSFKRSSDSSARTVVGIGRYEVVEVADAGRDGVAITLEALPGNTAQGRFALTLPAAAATQAQIAPGVVVTARERPFGWEFARADTRDPFFLLLADEWLRELASVPL